MSDSKKPGHITGVMQYCSLSRFFLNQTLEISRWCRWIELKANDFCKSYIHHIIVLEYILVVQCTVYIFYLQQKLLYFEMAKWKLSSFFKTSSCKDSYCKYLSMQQSEFLNDILLAGKTKNWLKDWQKRKLLWAYQPPKSLLLLKENLTALDGLTWETKLGQVKYLAFFSESAIYLTNYIN